MDLISLSLPHPIVVRCRWTHLGQSPTETGPPPRHSSSGLPLLFVLSLSSFPLYRSLYGESLVFGGKEKDPTSPPFPFPVPPRIGCSVKTRYPFLRTGHCYSKKGLQKTGVFTELFKDKYRKRVKLYFILNFFIQLYYGTLCFLFVLLSMNFILCTKL